MRSSTLHSLALPLLAAAARMMAAPLLVTATSWSRSL
jgi:hypothetical protein